MSQIVHGYIVLPQDDILIDDPIRESFPFHDTEQAALEEARAWSAGATGVDVKVYKVVEMAHFDGYRAAK